MRTFLLLLAASPSLFAWGNEGHSLVARIAAEQLTPAARARVLALLGPDATLRSVASWADDIRRSRAETAPWHFIDIQITDHHLDMLRDCPKNDCILVKIADFQKVLRDPAATPLEQREALMFIVHFVGDMHQPLHCSDHHDRGGNSLRVRFNDRDSNLHSVWDSGLLGRLGTEDQLFASYSPKARSRAKKWAKGNPSDWAEEVHKNSVKVTYGKLPKAAAGAVVPLDAKYEKAADSLLAEQIQKAGVRLAYVLNTTLR